METKAREEAAQRTGVQAITISILLKQIEECLEPDIRGQRYPCLS